MNMIKLTLILAPILATGALTAMEQNQNIVNSPKKTDALVADPEWAYFEKKELACQTMLARISQTPAGTKFQHFQEIEQFRALDSTRPQTPVVPPAFDDVDPITRARIANLEKTTVIARSLAFEAADRELACQMMLEQIKQTPAGSTRNHFQEIEQFRALDPARPRIPINPEHLKNLKPMIRIPYADLEKKHPQETTAFQGEQPVSSIAIAPPARIRKIIAERTSDTSTDYGQFFRFSYRPDVPNLSRESRGACNEKEKKRIHSNPVNTELTWHVVEYTGQQNDLSQSAHKRRMLLEAQSEVAKARSTLPGTTPE